MFDPSAAKAGKAAMASKAGHAMAAKGGKAAQALQSSHGLSPATAAKVVAKAATFKGK